MSIDLFGSISGWNHGLVFILRLEAKEGRSWARPTGQYLWREYQSGALTCCVASDQTVSLSVPHLSSKQDCLFLFALGQEFFTWVPWIWVGKIHPCSHLPPTEIYQCFSLWNRHDDATAGLYCLWHCCQFKPRYFCIMLQLLQIIISFLLCVCCFRISD